MRCLPFCISFLSPLLRAHISLLLLRIWSEMHCKALIAGDLNLQGIGWENGVFLNLQLIREIGNTSPVSFLLALHAILGYNISVDRTFYQT